MCFSAEASFIVGGSLIAVGAVTIRRAKRGRELPFASIPLLFGAQQMVEGVIWLSVQTDAAEIRRIATYIFSLFSHVLWPIYVPIAVGLMEAVVWRRRAIWGVGFIGMAVGVQLLILIATVPLATVVAEHVIYISGRHYEWPMMMLYIAVTCIAPLFSSYPLVRLFGAAALLLFFIAYWFYTAAFFSVWCFFAAILSAIIYRFFEVKQKRRSDAFTAGD